MYIQALLWDDDNLAHIARHGVTPEEVEDLCAAEDTLFTRVGTRRYQAVGQTESGR